VIKALGAAAQGLRLERMQASAQWVHKDSSPLGGGFRNRRPFLPGLRSLGALAPSQGPSAPSLAEWLGSGRRRVPSGPLPLVDPRPAWLQPAGSGLRATWLGHSTVLLEIDGARILTDPVWGQRASPLRLAGPKRFQPVPVPLNALPRPDVVLVSHDHYDHLDWPTIRALARTGVPFVTALGVGAHLEAFGVPAHKITELDWWESHRLPGTGIELTATPSQHFSGRGLKDRNATLWSSFVISGTRHRVFFSGDTGLSPQHEAIGRRFGPFDLVMLEVGAFHPAWGDMHLGPANALKALKMLGGGTLLPVHWGTFALAPHAWDAPAEHLYAQAPRESVRLLMPRLGEALEPDHVERVTPWWRDVDAVPATMPELKPAGERAFALWRRRLPWSAD
jgi:L-ascorbate metabolism protein UlaG (beta-lactamase superfamily)